MKILLTLFVLLFSSLVYAEDISDFEIEGISVGDSLLDHFSKKEIKQEIETNKHMYDNLEEGRFGEVYQFEGLKTYNRISFMVKPHDEKFIIFRIRGSIYFIKDIDECQKKQNEIVEEFSTMLKNVKKDKDSFTDEDGTFYFVDFIFNSGDEISVFCSDYEESLRIKNNWTEGLNVIISTKEASQWLSNY